MRYFILLTLCAFLCACAGAQNKQALSQISGGPIVHGQNLILNLTEADEDLLALFISITNPKDAKDIFVFDTPTRVNLSAVWPDGTETLLPFLTEKSRTFLRPVYLEPGQSATGILFMENKRAPKYHLSLVNEDEVFDFFFQRENK